MRIKTTSVRDWLASIMIVMMLFSQSVVVWANTMAHTHYQYMVQTHCTDEYVATVVPLKQNHCLQDNCEHINHCAGSCLSLCFVAGITMLPNTVASVIPYFDINLINQSLISPLYGRETSVLERPPRQFV